MQLPRISFVLYFMAIISLITLSNDILLLVNYPYADPTSSSVYKLHPVLYFSFISILFLIFFKRNIAIKELFFNKKFFYLYLIVLILFCYVIFILHQPLAPVVMTWLCPIFLLSLYFQCSNEQKVIISRACLVFITINSLIGIYEYVLSEHLIPKSYFSAVEGELLDVSEWGFYRSVALYGHPLSATMISALVTIALIIKSKSVELSTLEKTCLLLTISSLPTFGGRASIAIALLILSVFFFRNMSVVFRKGISKRTFILICIIIYILPLVLYGAYELGLFDKLLERIADDNGSAETRLVALKLMLDTPLLNFIFGDFDKTLFYRLINSGSIYGIEVSWIGLILVYGLIITIIILCFLYKVFNIVMLNTDNDFIYLFIGFLMMISSGTGLSTKSLALSQFLLVAFFIYSKSNKILSKI
jgi:hypothetical protein